MCIYVYIYMSPNAVCKNSCASPTNTSTDRPPVQHAGHSTCDRSMLKKPYISTKSHVHPQKPAGRAQLTPALCLYTYIYIHAYTYAYIHLYVCLYISLQALAKNSCASPTYSSTVTGPHCSTQDVAPATRAC